MNRSERRRKTANIVAKRKKIMRWTRMIDWITERTIGRCKNPHPLDCGNPQCSVCGGHKRRMDGKTRQERLNNLDQGDYN